MQANARARASIESEGDYAADDADECCHPHKPKIVLGNETRNDPHWKPIANKEADLCSTMTTARVATLIVRACQSGVNEIKLFLM